MMTMHHACLCLAVCPPHLHACALPSSHQPPPPHISHLLLTSATFSLHQLNHALLVSFPTRVPVAWSLQFVRPSPTTALEDSILATQAFKLDLLTPVEGSEVVVRVCAARLIHSYCSIAHTCGGHRSCGACMCWAIDPFLLFYRLLRLGISKVTHGATDCCTFGYDGDV